ncbi:MAG: preprotein translocase subunit YajC [Anaerolineae bacterium]|jgi:preprotein translocase subunit YajC|nr:preprotein translocase subunit YajC [Anaerolineae bacterium]
MDFFFFAFVMLLVLGAYWSLSIFPRQREFEKRQNFVRALAAGDEVITAGGLIGKVLSIDAEAGTALVEIADGVVVRAVSASLLQAFDPEELARNAQLGLRKTENA